MISSKCSGYSWDERSHSFVAFKFCIQTLLHTCWFFCKRGRKTGGPRKKASWYAWEKTILEQIQLALFSAFNISEKYFKLKKLYKIATTDYSQNGSILPHYDRRMIALFHISIHYWFHENPLNETNVQNEIFFGEFWASCSRFFLTDATKHLRVVVHFEYLIFVSLNGFSKSIMNWIME